MPLGGRQRKVLEPYEAYAGKSLSDAADGPPSLELRRTTYAASQRRLERVKGIEPSS